MRSANSLGLSLARSPGRVFRPSLLALLTLTSSLAQAQAPAQPPVAVVAPAPAPVAPAPVPVAPVAPPPVAAPPAPPVYAQPAPQPAPAAPPPAQYAPPAPQYAPVQAAPAPQYAPVQAAPQYAPAPAPAPAPQYAPAVYPAPPPAPAAASSAQPYPVAPGYPPPPPGYAYAPIPSPLLTPADVARRDMLHAELMRVEAQLAQVDAKRKGIGGPIAQTAVGLGGTLVFSAIALSAFAGAEAIQHRNYHHCNGYGDYDNCYDDLDVNDSGVVNHKDELALRRTAYAFTGLAAVGLAVGVSGMIRLARRSAERKAVKAERRGLLEQRNSLRQQLDYGVNLAPGQLQLGVQGKF